MRQTLFHVPHEVFGLPVFGLGWALLFCLIAGGALIVRQARRTGWSAETKGLLPVLGIVSAAIVFLLPLIEATDAAGNVLGLPVRGYGVMLTLGVVLGVGAAAYRARRMGIDPELIFSLAFWMFVAGIAGARILFVALYWEEFRGDTIAETVGAIFKFTEGGLVVYGSLIGGLAAAFVFIRLHNLPALATADIVSPCLLLGLALGRIGCLLNGCCYGGVCEAGLPSIRFPRLNNEFSQHESPPYSHQRSRGLLHGIRIAADPSSGQPMIADVAAGGPAADSGIKPGVRIAAIDGEAVEDFADAQVRLLYAGPTLSITTVDGGEYRWSIGALPAHSLPVHPTQIYGAINAALLFLALWTYYPFRGRDGEVFALFLIFYPATRFLLESIRSDEPGRFATGLTISQLVSLVLIVCGAALLAWLTRRPKGSALPIPAA